jgi:phosphoribosylformylglycinamidine cyclo-ligase
MGKVKKRLTYKSAGVDTTKKDGVIDEIIRLSRKTYDSRVIDHPWGFAGLFSILPQQNRAALSRSCKSPTLVACSDGVGTKLKLAFLMNKHDTVGIDLVAMSINDLIVTGAEPLFFLDYISCGKVQKKTIVDIVRGIVAGCEQSGCALLGGETAEMPDLYPPSEYDLAGFAVGLLDKNKLITGRGIKPGDIVIGLSSSGIHSNGYSLVRRVFLGGLSDRAAAIKLKSYAPELGCALGDELLKPTVIYARAVKDVLLKYYPGKIIKGIAHITGGGLVENIPRILPKNVCVEIDTGSFPAPPVFPLIQKSGNIKREEMYRVFNMGLGLVVIADRSYAASIVSRLKSARYNAYIVGSVKKRFLSRDGQVLIK